MKDKNHEGLANRPSHNGKIIPAATALIVSILLSDMAVAQPAAVVAPAVPALILVDSDAQSMVTDSMPLSVDTRSPLQDAASGVADEAEKAIPVQTKLALAGRPLGIDPGLTEVANGQSAIDATSEAIGGESHQKHYALVLALVTLISLVPMSRRQQ